MIWFDWQTSPLPPLALLTEDTKTGQCSQEGTCTNRFFSSVFVIWRTFLGALPVLRSSSGQDFAMDWSEERDRERGEGCVSNCVHLSMCLCPYIYIYMHQREAFFLTRLICKGSTLLLIISNTHWHAHIVYTQLKVSSKHI